MTERDRLKAVLDGKLIKGRVPHFEIAFFLTMEAFGKLHPSHRSYHQWDQMSEYERECHRQDMADVLIRTAEEFNYSAICLRANPNTIDESIRQMEIIRNRTGDRYFLLLQGDATYEIPQGKNVEEWVYWVYDNRDEAQRKAQEMVDSALKKAELIQKTGLLDGFGLFSDYCFNSGPFLSPPLFDEVVTPYLKKLVACYRQMGFYTIKHTDGNIMPILNSLAECNPHALHSLDPQAGVDIKEVKKLIGDRITLMGNVSCGFLDVGSDQECIESAHYALQNGMPGGRYIFSTSNCIYTGMRLDRYRLMLKVWEEEGNYI